ncbi:MAG: CBS domain-containing protein [Saprospiraceae bacterium]|nr:CBS domain-containing protein [Saprospiraceae bacterium]MDW8482960.1 CBS domain-containing protein [Saprospiraceae bacterium]
MNVFAPVSTIMVTDLVTVNPEATLREVKRIFETHSFHHLPVVNFRKIVGIVSRTDYDRFVGGLHRVGMMEDEVLDNTRVEEIMTTGLGKLEPDDRINVALEIFSKNWFHALPVVRNDELVGIVTTHDIIRALLNEKPKEPHLVYEDL